MNNGKVDTVSHIRSAGNVALHPMARVAVLPFCPLLSVDFDWNF